MENNKFNNIVNELVANDYEIMTWNDEGIVVRSKGGRYSAIYLSPKGTNMVVQPTLSRAARYQAQTIRGVKKILGIV